MKISSTTDYKQFKLKQGNRPIVKGMVQRLISSIEKRNLLSANPIIVNKNMEVIDGQHRLMAATKLKAPIYYIMVDKSGIEDVYLLNANMRAWRSDHFLDSFIARGIKEYVTFKEFHEKYRFPFTVTLRLLSTFNYANDKTIHHKFKQELFKVVDIENAEMLSNIAESILEHAQENVRKSVRFYDALFKTLKKDHEHVIALKTKLAGTNKKIYRVDRVHEYCRQFEDILNFRNYGKPVHLY